MMMQEGQSYKWYRIADRSFLNLTEVDTMHCTQCGAAVPAGQKFCQQCGAPVDQTQQASSGPASKPASGGPAAPNLGTNIDTAQVTRMAQQGAQQLTTSVTRAISTGNVGQLVVIGAVGIVAAIVLVSLLHAVIGLLPPLLIAAAVIYWARNRQRRW